MRLVRRGGGTVTRRRAQMALLSAQGMTVAVIVKVSFSEVDRVRDVPHKFNTDGFDPLDPRHAGGRPPQSPRPPRLPLPALPVIVRALLPVHPVRVLPPRWPQSSSPSPSAQICGNVAWDCVSSSKASTPPTPPRDPAQQRCRVVVLKPLVRRPATAASAAPPGAETFHAREAGAVQPLARAVWLEAPALAVKTGGTPRSRIRPPSQRGRAARSSLPSTQDRGGPRAWRCRTWARAHLHTAAPAVAARRMALPVRRGSPKGGWGARRT